MTERRTVIERALNQSGWSGWAHAPLAGDASSRRYWRLTSPSGDSRVLMDAPGDPPEAINRFVGMANHLRRAGLRAPRIDQVDAALGLIVMEDFGDRLLSLQVSDAPEEETRLYALAAEVLVRGQAVPPPPDLDRLDPEAGVRLVADVAEYLPLSSGELETVFDLLGAGLRQFTPEASALALRDYHAENIVVIPGAAGIDQLGLLDFQDAVLASPVYDLVSLIRDVRRDVSSAAQETAVQRFAELAGADMDAVSPALAVQAVQRNLRILGVFHRLAKRDGKTRYLDFLPRLHRLLREDLSHPDLAALAAALEPVFEEAHDDA